LLKSEKIKEFISYILVLFILVGIVRILPVYLKYKKRSYKNYSNSSWFKVVMNTRVLGEILIFYMLEKKFPNAKIFSNAYIPKEDNETIEIDLLIINEKD